MKHLFFKSLAAIALCAAAVSCQKDTDGRQDDPNNPGGENIKVKIVLDNPVSEAKTQWFNGDAVSLFSKGGATTLKSKGDGKTADFTGASVSGDKFYAFYPASSGAAVTDGKAKLSFPQEQTRADGALPADFPFGGTGSLKDGIVVKPVAAALAVVVNGNATVASLEVSGTGADGAAMQMSGDMTVGVEDGSIEVSGNTSVKLNAGNAVVSGTRTFFMYVPAGNYKGLSVRLSDSDGEGKDFSFSDIELKAGEVRTVEVAYSAAINLSANGAANCYVVAAAGTYKFDAKTVDGTTLVADGADWLWSSVECEWTEEDDGLTEVVKAVEPMNPSWVISDVKFDREKSQIEFAASGNVGNAVIALYREVGGAREIVWSFHIWSTGVSLEDMAVANWQSLHLVSEDKSFTWLDRNLGALNTKNTDNAGIHGNVYQWGRKDPFPGASRTGIGTLKEGSTSTFNTGFGAKESEPFTTCTMPWIANSAFGEGFSVTKEIVSVAETAKTPMNFSSDGTNWASDIDVTAWGDGLAPFDTWKGWAQGTDEKETYETTRKAAGAKSNNDPCPVGYRVPTCEELWNSFAGWTANGYTEIWSENITTGRSKRNYGRLIRTYTDPDNINTRIPCSGYRQDGKMVSAGEAAYYWSATVDPAQYKSGKLYGFRWLVGSNLRIEGSGSTGIARPVRCIRQY